MSIKQISAFVENQPGKAHELIQSIADAGINIRALNLADTKDFGVLRLIVDDSEKARTVMGESTVVITTPVLAVEMEDRAGALSRILKVLTEAAINIEYAYAFVTPTKKGAYTVIRVDKVEDAEKALSAAGFALLTQEEIDRF